jgi:FdrA protein
MNWQVRVLPNRYADSVRLMAAARAVRGRDGVAGCELAMGTPANLEALAARGAVAQATPGDLVIAVDGDDAEAAFAAAERELAAPPEPAWAGPARPRSLAHVDGANVALVSVPGEYATLEAHRALARGLHVFLFSDHVSTADEVALKRRGADRGLLVMGPGCGTAMLGGVGLGFCNVVRHGSVGIVAAAGTGAQEVACLIDAAGGGVSHIVGVGGRDLSSEVGGIMFREGMRRLAEDAETETLLLVSKPPAPEVVATLEDVGKRVVAAFVGFEGDAPFEVHDTLEAGALAAVGGERPAFGAARRDGALLGLFSGGSLAHEALTILGDDAEILDLGEEEYTQGRPHPMVDLSLRIEMIEAAAEREDLGCLLLDVVLGHGAHPDPASELAEPLARVAERATVIARVCGTPADPQDSERQARTLQDAGVLVAPSNAAAARACA